MAASRDHLIKLNIELKPTGHETDFEKSVVDLPVNPVHQVLRHIGRLHAEMVRRLQIRDVPIGQAHDIDPPRKSPPTEGRPRTIRKTP